MTGPETPSKETVTSNYSEIPQLADWQGLFFEADMWGRWADELEKLRQDRGAEALNRGVVVAMRAAAVDTGAIEGLYTTTRGFTIAVATQEANWEAQFAEKGPRARALYEAQLQAFGLARQLATARTPLSEAWIRQLHTELCTPQLEDDPQLPLGQYKTEPNKAKRADGTFHLYAAPERVLGDMQQIIKQLRGKPFDNLHPAVQAAFAHYALTAIHPFKDGNGRVARTLASAALFGGIGLPLVIYLDQRDAYLDALEAADVGRFQPFLTFVFDRALDSIRLVTDEMKVSGHDYGAVLRGLMTAQGGLSHLEIDGIVQQLIRNFMSEITQQVSALGLPVTPTINQEQRQVANLDPNYRSVPAGPYVYTVALTLSMPAPASATVGKQFYFLVAKDKTQRYPLHIQRVDTGEPFEIRLRDIYPDETADFKIRLRTWLRRVLDEGAQALSDQAEENLKAGGYR